jgi:ribose 5-phosphate isomerase A
VTSSSIDSETQEKAKRQAARALMSFIKSGMTLGLGSGSTVIVALAELAKLIEQGVRVRAVSSSDETSRVARQLGVPLVELYEVETIDVCFDGADQVALDLSMIKGRGGALTREKILAVNSERRIYLVDETKLVQRLGKGYLPVEVVPFGHTQLAKRLARVCGGPAHLRQKGSQPFITDNSNFIIDCWTDEILDPPDLDRELQRIPGVCETGIFVGFADVLIVGRHDHAVVWNPKEDKPESLWQRG